MFDKTPAHLLLASITPTCGAPQIHAKEESQQSLELDKTPVWLIVLAWLLHSTCNVLTGIRGLRMYPLSARRLKVIIKRIILYTYTLYHENNGQYSETGKILNKQSEE